MLYLFGQLALSDSLFYHENLACDDYPAAGATTPSKKAEASAHPTEASRTHRERPRLQADRATGIPQK